MYNQSVIGRSCENSSYRSSQRSFLPKPQVTPKKLVGRGGGGGFRSGVGRSANQTPPPRLLPAEEKEKLLRKLTPVQFKVTQEKVTERPYSNQYYKHFERGVYSCVVCGEPLFQSNTKYDSKSGWPAFYDIIDENKVRYKEDLSHLGANLLLLVCNPSLARIEVSCAVCNAHLGHMFEDGPKPTGRRFCVNSASLRFTSLDGDKWECLKRGKEEENESEKRKRKSGTLEESNEKDSQEEPLVHLAAPTNSCAMGSQICFRIPSVNPALS
ncbi:UNVERIFIED_CONTAM: hypothetical protein RMT77_017444 [Armadillidium vulgare]